MGMYHELMDEVLACRRRRTAISVVVGLLLAVAVALVIPVIGSSAREQGAVTLRQSILDAAARCCSVEGSYPATIDYLERHYGLRVNDVDYIVTYEAYASNVMPNVVVMPR